MFFPFKKIIFTISFNLTLFLLLMIGIQNSSTRKKINFIVSESVKLPISFIVGVSFISGSLSGSFLNMKIWDKK
tara:strand:- start:154 stop:375 length:222 start_codon:yes stop_codon:yes gene_type:complete